MHVHVLDDVCLVDSNDVLVVGELVDREPGLGVCAWRIAHFDFKISPLLFEALKMSHEFADLHIAFLL